MGKGRPAVSTAAAGKASSGTVKKVLESLLFLGKSDGPPTPMGRFEVTINEMVEKSGSVVMGRVHMINLNDLIIKRGGEKEKMMERAEKIAKKIVNEHLEKGDVYSRGEDGGLYFLFPDMSERAGELKCAVIGDQIARLLAAKDSIFFQLEVDSTAGTVDRKNVASVIAGNPAAKGAANTFDENARLREERERARMERAIAVAASRGGESSEDRVSHVIAEEADEPEKEPKKPPPEGMSVIYGTIWNVESKLLTAYNCILTVLETNGRPVRFKLKHHAEKHRQTILALDRYTLRAATARLRELLEAGQKTLVVLPVHFTTMNHDTSSLLYRKVLASLTDAERKHIVLELVDLPPDLPGYQISKTISAMRNVVRTVMARVPYDSKNLDSWRGTGVHAVGFDIGTSQIAPDALLPVLEDFAELAEKNELRTIVYGLDSISAVTMAVAAGFNYIEGDAVCAPVESISHVRPFDSNDLLAHLLP